MVSHNVIKKDRKLMPGKWWYVGAAVVAVLSLAVALYVGWQGLLLLAYSALILLVGRGKKISEETQVHLDN